MAFCTACGAEIAVYDRRCQSCGAGVRKGGSPFAPDLIAGAPTDDELSRARMCHLLALPGMVILAVFFLILFGAFALWGLLPLNLIVPFAYWLNQRSSPFVRGHGAEALNFQVLWTVVMYALIFVPISPLIWFLAYIVAFLGGVTLVLITSSDAASAGDGRYPIRIPLFR